MSTGTCQGLGFAAAVAAVLLVACPPPEEPACPIGEVQDVDTGECVPEHCGSEPWGLIERDSDTIHVALWGDDGWDGSAEWPYRTIQQGADEADGGLVAVAAGTYVENLELDGDHDGVEIAGRCAELVVIDGSGEEAPGVLVTGGEVGIRAVTVTGGWRGIEVVAGLFASARLVARGLLLEGNHYTGLSAAYAGTSVDLEDVTVRNTQPLPDGAMGWGVDVEVGASLIARGLLLEGNHQVGLFALHAGTSVDLEDTVIRDTQPLPDGTGGWGVGVVEGASLFARGLLLEGNHDVGLFAAHAGTTVDLEDATVRDTQPLPDGTGGLGISVQDGASLLAWGLLLEGNHDVGLFAYGAGTTVDLEDAMILDTQPLADGTRGAGIAVHDGASLIAWGLLLEGNHDLGLFAEDAGTTVDLQDATVRDTQPLPDGTSGRGVGVQDGASLVARGLLLDGNHDVGLFAYGAGTTVDLEDAMILDTQPLADGTRGRGISVQDGASLVARGLLLDGNHDVGLLVMDAGTTVDLEDATIRDTQPLPDGTNGRGISVQDGASLVARGLLLEGNHEVGLRASDAGATVDLEDATVRDTQPRPDGIFGRGINVQAGASLVARGLLLEGNHDVGLFATDVGTSVDLEHATIRDTQPLPDGTFGCGIAVQEGVSLVARGLLLERNHGVGLVAINAGTSVDLEGARIAGTRTPANNAGGFGVIVQMDASVTALGLQIDDNEGPGLYVVGGGTLVAWDATLDRNGFAAAVVMRGRLALHGGTVLGSVFHSSEAGGTGIFAWGVDGPPDVEVEGVSFTDLPGPALYARGPGRYVMRGCSVQDTGTWPWQPGSVFAVEGVEPWHEVGNTGYFTGLLLEGNTFADLNSDAILLDSSSLTLHLHPETGEPNTFGDLEGEPLIWQRCADVSAPETLDGSVPAPSCLPEPRTLGPLLEYRLWLWETEPLE